MGSGRGRCGLARARYGDRHDVMGRLFFRFHFLFWLTNGPDMWFFSDSRKEQKKAKESLAEKLVAEK